MTTLKNGHRPDAIILAAWVQTKLIDMAGFRGKVSSFALIQDWCLLVLARYLRLQIGDWCWLF